MRLSDRAKDALCVAIGTLLVGCASAPPPDAKLAVARSAIERAERGRAVEFAAVELADARRKFEQAESAATSKKMEQSAMLAEQAEVSALLAEAVAAAKIAEKLAQETDANLAALREEATRSNAQPQ